MTEDAHTGEEAQAEESELRHASMMSALRRLHGTTSPARVEPNRDMAEAPPGWQLPRQGSE